MSRLECTTGKLPPHTISETRLLCNAINALHLANHQSKGIGSVRVRMARTLSLIAELIMMRETFALSAQIERLNKPQTEREPMLKYCLAIAVFLFPFVAFSSDVVVPESFPSDIDTGEAFTMFLTLIGGLKGATAIGIALFVTQGLMLFFRTKLASFAGKWRLLIVTGLAVVSCVIALIASGVPVLASLVHAQVFASLQVFLNQFVKQFAKDETQA